MITSPMREKILVSDTVHQFVLSEAASRLGIVDGGATSDVRIEHFSRSMVSTECRNRRGTEREKGRRG